MFRATLRTGEHSRGAGSGRTGQIVPWQDQRRAEAELESTSLLGQYPFLVVMNSFFLSPQMNECACMVLFFLYYGTQDSTIFFKFTFLKL